MPVVQETDKGAEPESRQVQAWRANTDQAGILSGTVRVPEPGLVIIIKCDTSTHTSVAVVQIGDKKLKGKMRHTERLSSEAAVAAAKTDEWLLPAEAGTLEAEGMERTWRFSQVRFCAPCLAASLATEPARRRS